MQAQCKAGDLAVVINAQNRCNIGRIVKVLSLHDGKGELSFHGKGTVWLVESAQPLTWTIGKKRYRRKRGPVPDNLLKSIRGMPISHVVALHLDASIPGLLLV